MARVQHLYHYIYKTVCKITNRFYIGMHSTSNLNDGYIGSGKRLWNSINKHGKENHSIEILEWHDSREDLKNREIELITEDLLKDPMCMNLKHGGTGGNIGKDGEIFGGDGFKGSQLYWSDPINLSHRAAIASNTLKRRWKKGELDFTGDKNGFKGKSHTSDSKRLIGKINSEKQKNSGNSQFGRLWINDGTTNKKLSQSELPMYLERGWYRGRLNTWNKK